MKHNRIAQFAFALDGRHLAISTDKTHYLHPATAKMSIGPLLAYNLYGLTDEEIRTVEENA
jgi:hypothetical protein